MNEPEKNFTPLGTHLIRVDGDSVFFVIRGSVTAADLAELMTVSRRVRQEHGLLFSLYDARQATGMDTTARKNVISDHSTDIQPELQVIFGLSFSLRVVLNMMIRAQKLLRNFDVPLRIVEGEDEAYALFAKECARLRKTAVNRAGNA